jgi:hypothetical protein
MENVKSDFIPANDELMSGNRLLSSRLANEIFKPLSYIGVKFYMLFTQPNILITNVNIIVHHRYCVFSFLVFLINRCLINYFYL